MWVEGVGLGVGGYVFVKGNPDAFSSWSRYGVLEVGKSALRGEPSVFVLSYKTK